MTIGTPLKGEHPVRTELGFRVFLVPRFVGPRFRDTVIKLIKM